MSVNKPTILFLHTIISQKKEWLKILEINQLILKVIPIETNLTQLFANWQNNNIPFPDLVLVDANAKTADGHFYQVSALSRWCKEKNISMKIVALNGKDESISSFQQNWAKSQGLTGIFPKLIPNNLPIIISKINEILEINIKINIEKQLINTEIMIDAQNTEEIINNNIVLENNITSNKTNSVIEKPEVKQEKILENYFEINIQTIDNIDEDTEVITIQNNLKSLNTIISHNPSGELFYQRGNIYFSLENYPQALEDYEKAIKLNYKSENAFLGRSCAFLRLGDYRNSIKHLTQILKLNPRNALAYYHRGFSLFHSGDERGAKKDYDQAIILQSDFSQAYNARGLLAYYLGKTKEALQDYDLAIKYQPDYADAYYNRGNIYSDLARFQEAIADYTKAIDYNPKLALAYGNRGIANYELDLVDEAIKDTTTSANLFYQQKDMDGYKQAMETLKQMR